MEWVTTVLNWIIDLVSSIFDALIDFLKDMGLLLLEVVLGIFLLIISYLTLPTFIVEGLSSFMVDIDSSILYFLSRSGVSAGFDLIGAGVMFRLTRKLLTLGQW